MGALFSCCCGTEDDEGGEYGERTRLISECNTQTQIPAGLSDDFNYASNTAVAHSLPRGHNDETNKLGKILTDFAEEIIDISVVDHLDAHTLEPQEVAEKQALYSARLNTAGARIARDHAAAAPVLDNLTMRQVTEQLQNTEISESDEALICRMSKQVASLLGSMRVEQSEDTRDLVVRLGEAEAGAAEE